MAEEETTTTTKPANGEVSNNGKSNRKPQKEQKPIEELYDLSKPIPKVRN
jgi:hypothetical protein